MTRHIFISLFSSTSSVEWLCIYTCAAINVCVRVFCLISCMHLLVASNRIANGISIGSLCSLTIFLLSSLHKPINYKSIVSPAQPFEKQNDKMHDVSIANWWDACVSFDKFGIQIYSPSTTCWEWTRKKLRANFITKSILMVFDFKNHSNLVWKEIASTVLYHLHGISLSILRCSSSIAILGWCWKLNSSANWHTKQPHKHALKFYVNN